MCTGRAGLAGVMPRLLPRQQLREAMRPIAVSRQTAVELATVARLAVLAVEAGPRPRMLRARAGRLRLAPPLPRRRHPSDDATAEPRQNAQLEATGGSPTPTGAPN